MKLTDLADLTAAFAASTVICGDIDRLSEITDSEIVDFKGC